VEVGGKCIKKRTNKEEFTTRRKQEYTLWGLKFLN
jgi:hypothetical protein